MFEIIGGADRRTDRQIGNFHNRDSVLQTENNYLKLGEMGHQRLRARYFSLLLLRGSLRVCVLCALWQSCEECQSMRPGHAVQYVRRCAVSVRVLQSHDQEPEE